MQHRFDCRQGEKGQAERVSLIMAVPARHPDGGKTILREAH